MTAETGPATEPIPDWPGQQISLGDYQVFVRSVPADPADSDPADSDPADADPTDGEPDHREPAQREPALCVHGLAGSSRNWTDLMDLLRPVLACEAVDLPGFGDSPPRPDGRYSIGAFAQTVTALIQRRGRGQVHLIANSMGGAVAVKVAAAHPELVRTLTLISPALPESRVRRDMIWFPLMSLPQVGPRLLRRYEVLPPENRVADVITTCYSDPGRFPPARFATEVAELTRRDSLGWGPDALQGSVRALTAEFLRRSAWRDAAKITAPTLVIYGSDDRVVDARTAGRAAHTFANGRVVVLPHTGHVAQMEQPAQVAAEIGVLLGTPRVREFPLAPAG